MKPFFTPSAWDSGADALQFKSTATSLNGGETKSAKNKKSKKQKKHKRSKATTSSTSIGPLAPSLLGRGPLAPHRLQHRQQDDDSDDDTIGDTHKRVKSGRIEKPKNAKQQKQHQLTETKKKQFQLKPELAKAAVEASMEVDNATAAPPNALAAKLKAELMGGRFRYLNEQLYTMNSKKAESLFSKEPDAFEAYHAGYRQQVEKWPLNPLKRIIKTIKRLPKTIEIGDFGCGEGVLAQSVPHKVYSMDLVSTRDDIIACNITDTPLKAQSLDVAVYCLSLMGTNLNEYFLEANRVLKLHGNVHIAEIQSRFEDVRLFVKAMNACGFDLIKKDTAVNFFYFFHFKKMRHVGKVVKLPPFSLKPCLYRKR